MFQLWSRVFTFYDNIITIIIIFFIFIFIIIR